MNYRGAIESVSDLNQVYRVPESYTAGHLIGIIAVDLIYPKMPGNVANASTFSYPVLYKKVSFKIEQLFEGDPTIEAQIIQAAKELEAEGVRAIIGACGYFAHFQRTVSEAVDVPVYLSSLCQLPLIEMGLPKRKKTLVLAASGENLDDTLLGKLGLDSERLIIKSIGELESFAPIRWGKTTLDNGALMKELGKVAGELVKEHPEIGAILLECSDLPPYAYEIQRMTGLPVYDFITMIDWVKHAVVKRPYLGYL
ncbi:MAG: aspartate/glutamate racemase family protein [bacterium]|nr:aspartate/glutamate racemase family protein [bacterium]